MLAVALAAGAAVAAPGKGKGGTKDKVVTYSLFGTVKAVGEDSVTVDVEKGNKAARVKLVGQEPATFAVDSETKIERNDEDAALTDVQVGDEVKIQSKAPASATTFTARQLQAGPSPSPIPAPPIPAPSRSDTNFWPGPSGSGFSVAPNTGSGLRRLYNQGL